MISVVIVSTKKLLGQSLKFFLENEAGYSGVTLAPSATHVFIPEGRQTIVIYDLGIANQFIGDAVILAKTFPQAQILVAAGQLSPEEYNMLIRAGIMGSVLETDELTAVVKAMEIIKSGKISFPHEALHEVMLYRQDTGKKTGVLTEREIEVLQLLCDGLSNEQISERLHLSADTVRWHRSNILLKCECKNILSLYKYAVKYNLVPSS